MGFHIRAGQDVVLCYSGKEPEAVQIAIDNLETDLKKVLPGVHVYRNKEVFAQDDNSAAIIISTFTGEDLEENADWKQLADEEGVLRKESYLMKVQDGRLYISGTDRRGTIYGIYTFCEWMGVSPWYFFADVPVREKEEIRLEEGYCRKDWPSVEYRGIFINDEEELEAWVQNYMGEATIGVKSLRLFHRGKKPGNFKRVLERKCGAEPGF